MVLDGSSINEEVTRARIMVEYDGLMINNSFKRHKNGRELFYKWRLDIIGNEELSSLLGVGEPTLRMLRKRFKDNRSKHDKLPDALVRTLQTKRYEGTKAARDEMIKAEFEFVGGAIVDNENGGIETSIYDLLGLDESADLHRVSLVVHKKVTFDMVGLFNMARQKAMISDSDRKKQEWAKIALKAGGEIRPYIMDIIDRYSSLHADVAGDMIDAQEEQVKRLVDLMVQENPAMLPQIMGILGNAGGPQPDIIGDMITKPIPPVEAQDPQEMEINQWDPPTPISNGTTIQSRVYLVGGFPGSGKSQFAEYLSEATNLPIITYDGVEGKDGYREVWHEFIENKDECILDMVFSDPKQNKKFLSRVAHPAIIYIKSSFEAAVIRNNERERTLSMDKMKQYWSKPHPFVSMSGVMIIDNDGDKDTLRELARSFARGDSDEISMVSDDVIDEGPPFRVEM
jgi:hypothetical protein